MAVPEGFEPSTHRLEGDCSIQLNYGTIVGGIFSSIPPILYYVNYFLSVKVFSSSASLRMSSLVGYLRALIIAGRPE
jgi:hypothetical protein